MACAGEGDVKVLTNWRSMFGMRVLIALNEKGVPYTCQEEDLPDHKSQLLLHSNPIHKKVPVLLHCGKPICESLIIVEYIDETWPSHDKPFLPVDPYERALSRFWADYVDKKVFDAGALIFMNVEGDAMEQGKKNLLDCMVTLDVALCDVFGGGPYFGGKHINMVDISLAPFICWFETYETLGKFKLLEENNCPHLFRWAQTVAQHPSVKEGISNAPPDKVLGSACMLRKRFLGV
ncbi:hypothetical protein GOP47_0027366 [Adiantum capillus-veneris]|nr:hypothetical protein GOP47_0027366 [Adiantum capillus-veneris]